MTHSKGFIIGALAACALFASAAVTRAATPPKPGDLAPYFEAQRQDGKILKLSDFKGQPVVLYFYPKDDTPGCTKQACDFRDGSHKLKELGAVVLGVSAQNLESHTAFKTKYKLPFDLISDPEGRVAEAYGVGRMPLIGLMKRETFLINADGKVVKHYPTVDPKTHIKEVFKDLEALADK